MSEEAAPLYSAVEQLGPHLDKRPPILAILFELGALPMILKSKIGWLAKSQTAFYLRGLFWKALCPKSLEPVYRSCWRYWPFSMLWRRTVSYIAH
jgi:hypothetical protein